MEGCTLKNFNLIKFIMTIIIETKYAVLESLGYPLRVPTHLENLEFGLKNSMQEKNQGI